MKPEEIEAAKERHINEQFAALGRFVQAFEQMVDAVRFGCHFMTQMPGAGPKSEMTYLIWHHHVMTAGPLYEIYRAMLTVFVNHETSVLNAEDKLIVLQVLSDEAKEYADLVSTRNELVHGTWFIGWGSSGQVDFSEFLAVKSKVKASGLASAEMPKSAVELLALVARCERVERVMRGLPIFTSIANHPEMPGLGVAERIKKVDGKWDNPGWT